MENQKIKMKKRKFRIGELAKKLKVKKFVIRFWEKEFDLESDRSGGGQRFYTQNDLETFSKIKDLLYEKKFTIPGARKQLAHTQKTIKPALKQSFQPSECSNKEPYINPNHNIWKKIKVLKANLEKLKKMF